MEPSKYPRQYTVSDLLLKLQARHAGKVGVEDQRTEELLGASQPGWLHPLVMEEEPAMPQMAAPTTMRARRNAGGALIPHLSLTPTLPRACRLVGLMGLLTMTILAQLQPVAAAPQEHSALHLPGVAEPVQPPSPALQATGMPSSGQHMLGLLPSSVPAPQVPTPRRLLPPAVDLTQFDPPVGDQGTVASCVAWATGYYLRGWYARRDGYYPAGGAGNTGGFAPMYTYTQIVKGSNVATSFADHYRIQQQQGIDSRSDYSQGDYDYTSQPTNGEHANAARAMISSYSDVGGPNLQQWIENTIASGNPVAIGINVYDNFFNVGSSNYYYSSVSGRYDGNHAVFAAKYDASGLWIENSWGTGWGLNGYAELSWSFVNQYAFEATSIVPLWVQFQAPVANATVSGLLTLQARTSSPYGVQFTAYYATNPGDISTVAWRPVGKATQSAGGVYSFTFDTRTIPDQDNAGWGTVNFAAIPLDQYGNPMPARDYRRVSVQNVAWIAPAANTTVSGTIALQARTSSPYGIVFTADYATNPSKISTVGWHTLCRATIRSVPGIYACSFDTRTIPDQGNAGWGTVNVAATALDQYGNPLPGVTEYIRVNINNH